jgi:hypothetical protein
MGEKEWRVSGGRTVFIDNFCERREKKTRNEKKES